MGVRRSRLDVIDLNRVVRAAFMPAGLAPSIVLLEHPVPQFEPIPGLEKVIIIHARVDSMTSLTLSSVSGRRMTRTPLLSGLQRMKNSRTIGLWSPWMIP